MEGESLNGNYNYGASDGGRGDTNFNILREKIYENIPQYFRHHTFPYKSKTRKTKYETTIDMLWNLFLDGKKDSPNLYEILLQERCMLKCALHNIIKESCFH